MNDKKLSFTVEDARSSDVFCVFLASLAYKAQLEIEKELADAGYPGTNVIFFKGDLASCFIVRWDDVTAIAFKGTTTWREWLNNCNVYLEPTQFGRIHAGFKNTIQNLGPILYRIIYPDIQAGAKIVLTGHSRGGALALVFACFLALNGCRAHRVAMFGSPKVGDEEFVCRVQGKAYEPEPIPPQWSFAGIRYRILQFRVVFIPVVLYQTTRYFCPAIRAHFVARLNETTTTKRLFAVYRRLRLIFRRERDVGS